MLRTAGFAHGAMTYPVCRLLAQIYEVLFAEPTIKIASLLEQQGFHRKIVREIHQFVVEVSAI
jgi:hypothetical protein